MEEEFPLPAVDADEDMFPMLTHWVIVAFVFINPTIPPECDLQSIVAPELPIDPVDVLLKLEETEPELLHLLIVTVAPYPIIPPEYEGFDDNDDDDNDDDTSP